MDDETLILTVGGTPRPLEVAIEQIKPKFVYFIHSKETLKTVEAILENVTFDLEYSLVKIDDPESLSEAFDKSNDFNCLQLLNILLISVTLLVSKFFKSKEVTVSHPPNI